MSTPAKTSAKASAASAAPASASSAKASSRDTSTDRVEVAAPIVAEAVVIGTAPVSRAPITESPNAPHTTLPVGGGMPLSSGKTTTVIQSSVAGLQAAPLPSQVNAAGLNKIYTPAHGAHAVGAMAMMQQMLAQMETMSVNIDTAAKRSQENVSVEAQALLTQATTDGQRKQKELIAQAQNKARVLEQEINTRREALLAELDAEWSSSIKQLEAELQAQQQAVERHTQAEVARINEATKDKKMQILGEAQAQHQQLDQGVTTSAAMATSSVQGKIDTEAITKHHLVDKNGAVVGGVERGEAVAVGTEPRSTAQVPVSPQQQRA